jgi:hypothetical protein
VGVPVAQRLVAPHQPQLFTGAQVSQVVYRAQGSVEVPASGTGAAVHSEGCHA